MNAQQLKNSILQMAIQGKLVPQDPADKPASILLQHIAEEKEALVKAGKIKKEGNPSVIFRGRDNLFYEHIGKKEPVCISDDLPFDIPDSWKWVRISSIANLYTGNSINETDKKVYFTNVVGMDYIGTKDVGFNQCITYNNGINIPIKNLPNFKIAPANSILLCIEGGSAGRKIALTNKDVCFGNKLCCFNTYFNINKFLFYFLQSSIFLGQFQSNITGIIGGVSVEKLKSVYFPIPPLEEQGRIVKKLEELLPFVEKYRESEYLLNEIHSNFPEQLKKSILQLAVQGKLVSQDLSDEPASVLLERIRQDKEKLIKSGKIKRDKHESVICRKGNSYYETVDGVERCIDGEVPFDIPDSWEWTRFSNICSIINGDRGKNYPAKSKLTTTGIPFISALNLTGNTISVDDNLLCLSESQYNKLRSGKLSKGDIIICIRGSLGKHGIYPFDKGAIASSLVIARPVSAVTLVSYIIIYLDTPLFFREIKKYDNGTAQPNLAAGNLEKFLFPIPPIEEQQRIVEKVEELLLLLKSL